MLYIFRYFIEICKFYPVEWNLNFHQEAITFYFENCFISFIRIYTTKKFYQNTVNYFDKFSIVGNNIIFQYSSSFRMLKENRFLFDEKAFSSERCVRLRGKLLSVSADVRAFASAAASLTTVNFWYPSPAFRFELTWTLYRLGNVI